jgi:hypothetical protein
MDEGAFLGNLEQEERSSGQWSYPAGHPRRVALEAGKDPDSEALRASGALDRHPEAPSRSLKPLKSEKGGQMSFRLGGSSRVTSATRTNRWETPCDTCGEPVYPGEGKVERTSTGWSTSHLNER